MKTLTSRTTWCLLLWGLALNAAWEWAQCAYLYDMSGSTVWKGAVWMSAAVVADGFIVLAVAGLAWLLNGKRRLAAPDAKGWAALLGVGLAAGVFLEWVARVLNLWNYGPLMPTLPVGGVTVGLAPLVQMTLLPAFCVWLATRRKKSQAGCAVAEAKDAADALLNR